MTLRTLNYGNYGIFLLMGSAGFCPSAVFWGFLIVIFFLWVWVWGRGLPGFGFSALQPEPQTKP